MQIAKVAVGVRELTEEQCATVAQSWLESAELVSCVGLRDGRGTVRHGGSHQQGNTVGAAQPGRIEAEFFRQQVVEHQQLRVRGGLRLPRHSHLRKLAGEQVAQNEAGNR
jgi:hypothetical protein